MTLLDEGGKPRYFCLFFKGSSFTLNDWSFDDFVISSQEEKDLGIASIDVPKMSNYGEHEISFTVQNVGSKPITSFEAKYTIDNKEFTETFSTNIETLDFQQFTFSRKTYIPDLVKDLTAEFESKGYTIKYMEETYGFWVIWKTK